MGNCCGCCGGGEESGGRGGRNSVEGSGDLGHRRAESFVEYCSDSVQVSQGEIPSAHHLIYESRSRTEPLHDGGLSARPFIKGTCSVDEHEDGGSTGGVDGGGGGSNYNDVQ